MRVLLDMVKVVFEDFSHKLVLGVVDGLDDEAIVLRKVKETATLARRTQLREDVLARQRDQVIRCINVKVLSEMTKDPRRIVLELEIVLRGWRQLVTGDVKGQLMSSGKVFVHQHPLRFCVAARDTDSNTCQHVVHENIVDMVFSDTGTNQDAVVVFILFPLGHAPTATLLQCLHAPLSLLKLIHLHLIV